METIIEIKEFNKFFGNLQVLKDINMELEKGKIYGIVGRNGSGKTVLFKSICGFFPVEHGSIRVRELYLEQENKIPENIGMIIETPGFLPNYNGYHNLEFLYCINHKKNKQVIYHAMEQVGLDPKLKRHVGKYSLGMRQRLGIAQAIMEDPDILVLDEPMNGLDKEGVEDIRKLLLQLKEQGKTILIASHNREDIDVLCDHVWSMDHGVPTKVF